MNSPQVAVVGAHGKTGRAVTQALRARGATVRELGRTQLVDPTAALHGCDAVYLIAPNMHPDEPAFVQGILNSLTDAEVPKVVYHSVATPYAPAMPHHMGKVVSEDIVRRLSASWAIVQPGPYLQNLVPTLKHASPVLDQPYDVDQPFNFVDLLDVAEAAAEVVLDSAHDGATYELAGPDRMGVRGVARIAAEILRADVPSRRIEPAEWAAGPGAALEPRERDWLLAMFEHYDHHGLLAGPLTLGAVLGRPPTGIRAALERELRDR